MSDDGGPAFPCPDHDGLTLRDYFAAKALPLAFDHEIKQCGLITDLHDPGGTLSVIAANAYSIADAMLEARK